jgi:hypothetical protein
MLSLVVSKRGDRGFCFDDLIGPAKYHGATIGELAEWLAQAQSSGLIETVVTDPAERTLGRRFRIATSDYPNRGMAEGERLSTNEMTPSASEPR